MEVHLPDKGMIVEFPDSMTTDQVRDVIKRKFYPEKLTAQGAAPTVSQAPAPVLASPAPVLAAQPTQPEEYYPQEFAGFADPNMGTNIERGIREAAPVAPSPLVGAMQSAGRAVQGVMDPVFEYGVAPFMGGAISGATRFADAAGYLADKIGSDTIRDKLLEIGGAGSRFGAELTQGTAPEDLGAIGQFIRATAGAAGSSLPSLALGMAATPAQGASWASNTAMALHGGSDALGEAGNTMREVLAQDGSIEEARSAANKVAMANLLYNAIAEPLAGPFSGWGEKIPGLKGHLMRGAVRGTEEMAQETLQDMWSAAAQKRREDRQPVTYGDVLENFLAEGKDLPAYLQESGAPAFLSSFLMGAGMPHVAGGDVAPTPNTPSSASVAEVPDELRKEDDARQALPREERAKLMRWAREETGRMGEEAQFAEDKTMADNALGEADLVRYQAIRDAMKRKDFAALAEMRGEAEATRSAVQPEPSHEDAAVGLAPEAVKVVSPRKGRYTDMDEFVAAATSPEGKKIGGSMWVDFAPVSDETADRIQEDTGIDVHGYGHALDGSAVVHILNRHGPKGTAFKDFPHQLSVTPDDFKLMPEVLENPDTIENTRSASSGNERIIFKKKVNGHALLVEEVRGRLGKLIPVSMWKEKSEAVSPTSETSPTPSGPVSATSPFEATLPPSGESVNTDGAMPSAFTMKNGAQVDFASDGGATLTLPNTARTTKEFGSRGEMKEWMSKHYPGGLRDLLQWEARQAGELSNRTDPKDDPTVFDIDERAIQGSPADEGDEGLEEGVETATPSVRLEAEAEADTEAPGKLAELDRLVREDDVSSTPAEPETPPIPDRIPADAKLRGGEMSVTYSGRDYTVEVKPWEKYGKRRLYLKEKESGKVAGHYDVLTGGFGNDFKDSLWSDAVKEHFTKRLGDWYEGGRASDEAKAKAASMAEQKRESAELFPKDAALKRGTIKVEFRPGEPETLEVVPWEKSGRRLYISEPWFHGKRGNTVMYYDTETGEFKGENRAKFSTEYREKVKAAFLENAREFRGYAPGELVPEGETEKEWRKRYSRLADVAEIALDLDEGQGFDVVKHFPEKDREGLARQIREVDMSIDPEKSKTQVRRIMDRIRKLAEKFKAREHGEDELEQYEQRGKPLSQEEADRLAKEVEEKLIAAGRDVEEAKAMGLLAADFARRFARRTNSEAKDALNMEFRKGDRDELRGEGYEQIVGRSGAEALDRNEEGTTRLDNLNVAREMEQAGKDPGSIRLATGWERGADGKWRYEIPDGTFRREGFISNPDLLEFRELERKFIEGTATEGERSRLEELKPVARQVRKPSRLSDFYDAPELYAAYPELADISIKFQDRHGEARGSYSPSGNTISLDTYLRGDAAKTVLVHEIQHAIQDIEGFARGGNLENGGKQYHRLAGEAEARNAGRRVFLTDKERRERLLAETEDVAREDQIILEEMMEGYSSQQVEETENIRRGQAAMEKVITEQTDVMDAMHRDDLGSISFLWGEPGRGGKFKGGWGVSHLIAHRNAQGYDGEAVARKMVEVIAKGALDKTDHIEKGSRAYLKHDGYTAVMSLYRDGERQTWLLTGWEDYKEKAPGEIGSVYDDLNPTLSEATRFHPEEGAGASAKSKPPVAQKGKSKTAPNGRTYFLPDGTTVIEFFETANRSTSFHEFGHHIFNKMLEFSGKEGVDPQMAEDIETILKAAGVTREAFDADKKNARRRAHEFFARGFEKYLAEGRAPTKALRDVFRRIRDWMIEVYEKIANIPGKGLSDAMRGVYRRLFASDGAFGDIYGAEDVKAGTNMPEIAPYTVRKSGVEVDRKFQDTSNDTRMMDLFNSPNVVAERHGKFRPFFNMAKDAVEKQERMRSNWNRAVDAIYGKTGLFGQRGGLLSKAQVPLFNETLLEGDAIGKVFTAAELDERGFTPDMKKAYRLVRGLYDNAHRMLSSQRNKYGKEDMAYREGYVPHFFHAWRVLEDGKIVTSFRSMNEAVKAAEKMKKEDESRSLRVAPALDDFGGRGKLDAVTLGDMQYFKLVDNIKKAFELSSDEARDLLEDSARMKGRSRMFKNAWERKGMSGFDENMEYALRHYLNLSARYIAMDTLKHDGINMFERAFGRFDHDHKGLARYTKDYLNDVLGVPSGVEETLNKWVRNSWLGKYLPDVLGDRPATVAANSIAGLIVHAKLGFLNTVSALMNITQLVETQAIVGPTLVGRAIVEYLRPNMTTKKLYLAAGVDENITAENPSGYSKVHQARGLLAETSMAAFRAVDGMARKVTLIAAYRKARAEGQTHHAAVQYAKKVNDDVNFDYSVADAPNFIRRTGPIGTVLFQFKKFPIKMLELALPGVGKLRGWEQARFWAPMLALSGMFGLPGFDWLKDWIKSIFGKDIELEVKKWVAESSLPESVKRTVLYGALSNLGIDVGRRVGMGDFFPSELKDLTGPAAATIARVVESLPKIFDDGNFIDTIEAISPGMANPIKAFMGETRDRRRDRVAFRYETPGERIARATGARPLREAIENDAMRIARYEQQNRTAAETDAIDDFLRARGASDTKALERARTRLRELRITPDRLKAELMRRRGTGGEESTAYERALRGARTPRRREDYRTLENYVEMWE